MNISFDADVFRLRKQGIDHAGNGLEGVAVGGWSPIGSVPELAGIDGALAQLQHAVLELRSGLRADLSGSSIALEDTAKGITETEDRVRRVLDGLKDVLG